LTITDGTLSTGNLSVGGTTTLNAGTLSVGSHITIDGGLFDRNASSGFALANSGAMTVQHGGTAEFTGSYTTSSGSEYSVVGTGSKWSLTGDLTVDGSVPTLLSISDGGIISATSLFVGIRGVVQGDSKIIADVRSNGTVSPGISPGTLTIDGNYLQDSDGTLLIELGGTTPGTHFDSLQITGGANLDGTLDVSLIDGFVPGPGDSFIILNAAAGIVDTFATEILPAVGGGLLLEVEYGAEDVVLNTVGVLGDYNLNGIVDAADYTVWRDSLGQMGTTLAANGNRNDRIDAGDYDVWRAHFGQIAGSGSAANANAAVPEPSTLWMLLAGILTMSSRRRAAML
jgi:hypothetical protein